MERALSYVYVAVCCLVNPFTKWLWRSATKTAVEIRSFGASNPKKTFS